MTTALDIERKKHEATQLPEPTGYRILIAIPEKDLDRTSAEGKASSVQFIHFNFSKEQIKEFRNSNVEIIIGIDHKFYNHMTKISIDTREALSKDFI